MKNYNTLWVVIDIFIIALNLFAAFNHFTLFSLINIAAAGFVAYMMFLRTKRTGQWDSWVDWLNRRRVKWYFELKAKGWLK